MLAALPLNPPAAAWEFFWPRADPGVDAWLPAEVPGGIHLDLRRHGLIPDPFWGANEACLRWIEREGWTYRCRFEADAELMAREVVELVAEGLDTLATLTLNGEKLGPRTDNMFTAYRWPVKRLLRPGVNELRVHFDSPMPYIAAHRRFTDAREWNDFVGGCAHLRKEQCQFGWDWGPRFVTAGVWRPVRLEAWNAARLETVRVCQEHARGRVTLHLSPRLRLAGTSGEPVPAGLAFRARLSLDGTPVSEITAGPDVPTTLPVPDPQLWWPHGHGAQPLYTLEVALLDAAGAVLDTWTRHLGLRTVALDRSPDAGGERFGFVVNGRPVFAKGANWIPAHAFVTAADRETLDDLLSSATDAHMNMLRVWGGGVYESETFYDLCDEKGLLVWQDFMFACALYPGAERPDFLRSVGAEADHQVQRLAHRACLALWCGNNEIEQMALLIRLSHARVAAFERIFYDLLPAAVARHDGVTPYWPGSPHNPAGWRAGANSACGGDAHYWDVWHARKPVKAYETTRFRFVSEFGMQSYPSPGVAATFCPPEQCHLGSPAFENHQKNAAGNPIILEYLARRYRVPQDYPALAYLSQIHQLHAMKVAVEHFRRSMPHTMGALYWQLNDCWPAASWSSLEFGGGWKALHHGARRFFAPALVSAHLRGDAAPGEVHLWTIFDGPDAELPARLRWELRHLGNGRCLEFGEKETVLRRGESLRQQRLDFSPAMAEHGAANLFLHLTLGMGEQTVSEDTVFLLAPRFLNLPRAPVEIAVPGESSTPGGWQIQLRSPAFQHGVSVELPGVPHRASDNFFDLLPGRPRTLSLHPRPGALALDAAALRGRLRVRSLVDSY